MTIQELIDQLQRVQDKSAHITCYISDTTDELFSIDKVSIELFQEDGSENVNLVLSTLME